MNADGKMRLAAYYNPTGHHVASWRHDRAQADASTNLKHYVEIAQTAERSKFDLIFLADNAATRDAHIDALCRSVQFIAHFEPLTLLSALAMVTDKIGLVATASTSWNEPYHLARKFASLDHISGGRAGWNVVTSGTNNEAKNFGHDTAYDHADRYERAREVIKIVKALWDSWDDDAFIRDKESGLFFDPAKMHFLNYKSARYQIRGPLNVPRTPQGYPLLVQAGGSNDGRETAAQFAEAIFSPHLNVAAAKEYYDDVKGRMAKYGRDPEHLKILPGISVIVRPTEEEANADYELLQSQIHPIVAREILSTMLGEIDLTAYPLDGPLPDLPDHDGGALCQHPRNGSSRKPHHPPGRHAGGRRARQECVQRQPDAGRRLHGGMVRQAGVRRLHRDAALHPGRAGRFLRIGDPRTAPPRAIPHRL